MSSTPHDALFKAAFSDPVQARGELRAALPESIVERVEWSTLALCPGSFVDPVLSHRHTDLLFSARWQAGTDALIYVLFEHQSSCEPLMGYRLLRYLVRIWERWLEEHADARRLPAIIPLVLYHGDAPWSAPVAFAELIDLPTGLAEVLRPYLVDFRYRVDDLTVVSDVELRERVASAYAIVTMLCLKHARTRPDLPALLVDWTDLLDHVFNAPNGADAFYRLMRYILQVNEHITPEVLVQLIEQQHGPAPKDVAMTAGERLIEQGERRGIEKGIEQGQQLMVLTTLRRRFGESITAEIEQRVTAASPAQLQRWIDQMMAGDPLHELFGS